MPGEFVFVPTHYSPELQSELAKGAAGAYRDCLTEEEPQALAYDRRREPLRGGMQSGRPAAEAPGNCTDRFVCDSGRRRCLSALTGLMEPKNMTLLVTGVIALVIAAARFLPRPDADMTRQFQKSAALLLKSLGGLDLSSKPKIRFTDEAMQIKTNQKSADFPYEKMETLVETPSLFLLTHSGSATVLQKKDLILGTPEEFLDFFRAHAACPCAKLTEE